MAQIPNLEYAKGVFIEGNWPEAAQKLEEYLLVVNTKDEDIYARTVLAYVQSDETDKASQILRLATLRDIKVEVLFDRMQRISQEAGMPGIFERIFLLTKKKKDQYSSMADHYLLHYYLDNHKDELAILVLEDLLAENPKQVDNLLLLASAYHRVGKDSMAVVNYKKILTYDETNYEANLFIGAYYYLKAEVELKRIKMLYLPDNLYTKMDYARYQLNRKEIISTYVSRSVVFLESAEVSLSTDYLRKMLRVERALLAELMPKNASRKEREMFLNVE
jgi:tetratricopeptide (TPR) repeat protein